MTDERILSLSKESYDLALEIRRKLHSYPEIGRKEYKTTEYIKALLEKWGIKYEALLETGVVAFVESENETSFTVALRADIDALNITEKADVPFCSQNEGFMHACGHDMHTAALLVAAKLISENKALLPCNVKFIFQPDEECDGGAERLIEKGVMDNVDKIYGIHVRPELKAGTVEVRYGKSYAASDIFELKVIGKSSHCAHPHSGVDAVLVSCHIVSALQSLISRNTAPTDSAVLTVGTINGGNYRNIVPGTCEITGVTRTLGREKRLYMRQRIEEISKNVAKAFGAACEVKITESYPGIVNHDSETAFIEKCARELFGDDNVSVKPTPDMTSEDFGYYLDKAEGTFYHIGCECEFSLHSEYFCPDETALISAVAMHLKSVFSNAKN